MIDAIVKAPHIYLNVALQQQLERPPHISDRTAQHRRDYAIGVARNAGYTSKRTFRSTDTPYIVEVDEFIYQA